MLTMNIKRQSFFDMVIKCGTLASPNDCRAPTYFYFVRFGYGTEISIIKTFWNCKYDHMKYKVLPFWTIM